MVKVKVIGAVVFVNPNGSYFVCHAGDVVELDEARAAPYIANGTLEVVREPLSKLLASVTKENIHPEVPVAPVKKRKVKR